MIIYNHIYIYTNVYFHVVRPRWKVNLKTLSSLFRDRIHHIRQVDNLILSINSLPTVLHGDQPDRLLPGTLPLQHVKQASW